jgi:hypothetical protein
MWHAWGYWKKVKIWLVKRGGKREIRRRIRIWEDNNKIVLREGWRAWVGLIWLRIRNCGEPLWTRQQNFWFRERCRNIWLPEQLLSSQSRLLHGVSVRTKRTFSLCGVDASRPWAPAGALLSSLVITTECTSPPPTRILFHHFFHSPPQTFFIFF